VSIALLLLSAFVIFQPIVAFLVHEEVDYANHLSYLRPDMDMQAVGEVLSMFPHFLYHLLVYSVFKLFSPESIHDAALAVSLSAYLLGALATYWLITRFVDAPRTYGRGLLYVAITLALMLLMPIDLFTPTNLFVGYIGVNAYHNPTIVLLKPSAIVLFWCAGTIFQKRSNLAETIERDRSIPVWLCALVTVICVLSKPSYVIALLPGLAVFAGCWLIRRWPLNWPLLIWGIGIPAGLILSIQMVAFRSSEGFIFAPLAVIYSWQRINVDAPDSMVWKFLLSITFPLVVYLLYCRIAIRNVYLNLAWVVFGFGAAYMYLLAEGGERLAHANFTWSTISALYILFIISAIFLFQRLLETPATTPSFTGGLPHQIADRARVFACGLVFGLHVASGLYWYTIHRTANWMGDIIANKW
jgi:hypothetical protein